MLIIIEKLLCDSDFFLNAKMSEKNFFIYGNTSVKIIKKYVQTFDFKELTKMNYLSRMLFNFSV